MAKSERFWTCYKILSRGSRTKPEKSDKAYGAIYTNTIAANSRLLKCLGKCVIDTNRLVPEKITFKTLWALLLLGALVDE